MPTRSLFAVAASAVVALTGAAGAAAHGGTRTQGYVSTFSTLEPSVLGVSVNVFGPTNRFRLANYSGKTVVVLGYQREPWLRFSALGVDENLSSPTRYLNASRPVPASAALGEKPRWQRVTRSSSYTWHDDRIVWTGAEPPPVVQQAPDEPHLIFRWRIPATVEGEPLAIKGFLGWAPAAATGDGNGWLLPAGAAAAAVALAFAAGLVVVLRARRTRRRAL